MGPHPALLPWPLPQTEPLELDQSFSESTINHLLDRLMFGDLLRYQFSLRQLVITRDCVASKSPGPFGFLAVAPS